MLDRICLQWLCHGRRWPRYLILAGIIAISLGGLWLKSKPASREPLASTVAPAEMVLVAPAAPAGRAAPRPALPADHTPGPAGVPHQHEHRDHAAGRDEAVSLPDLAEDSPQFAAPMAEIAEELVSAPTLSEQDKIMADPRALLMRAGAYIPPADTLHAASELTGHLIVQLDHDNYAAGLAALRQLGLPPLQKVPYHAVMVHSAEPVQWPTVPGIRWVGKLRPEDKIGRLPTFTATATAYTLVDTIPGPATQSFAALASSLGAIVMPRQGLPPTTLLVEVHQEALLALLEHDAVAYVWPPSAAILQQEVVHFCPGPLSEFGYLGQYVTVGNGWDGAGLGSASLAFHFINYTGDLSTSTQRQQIFNAMNAWWAVAQVGFTESSTRYLSRSIDIGFGSGYHHGCDFPFDGASGTLAHAYYPPPSSSESIAGDLHFDESETWRVGSSGIDLFTVALHELGHSLGLGHSANPNAVMYASYSGAVTGLHTDDIAGIRALYANRASTGPANNHFANATTLTGNSGSVAGSTVFATRESGEPAHHGNSSSGSAWWRWTVPATGQVTIDTSGSAFDTILAVYTGSSVSALTLVASNDDDGSSTASKVSFSATAGTTYRIAVAGYDTKSGAVTLNWLVNPTLHLALGMGVYINGSFDARKPRVRLIESLPTGLRAKVYTMKVTSYNTSRIDFITSTGRSGLYGVELREKNKNTVFWPQIIMLREPVISDFSPAITQRLAYVTISGDHFGKVKGQVRFGSKRVKIISWDNRSLAVQVPKSVKPGAYAVSVKTKLGSALAASFIEVQ